MARYPGVDAIYEVANEFRDRCLTTESSLLWPSDTVWTGQNLTALWDAFIGHPDAGKRSFLAKWKDQLSGCPPAIHKLAADLIVLYQLPFVTGVLSARKKMENLTSVLRWKLSDQEPDFSLVQEPFSVGLMHPGMYYLNAGRPSQIAFYLEFARRVHADRVDSGDVEQATRVADETEAYLRTTVKANVRAARHILLHLLFPDLFERIASDKHKKGILKAFQEYTEGAEDPDKALLNVRRSLSNEYGRPNFDFYDDEEIRRRWRDRQGLLESLATLLETRRLDEPDVINASSWAESVRPVTRPFLELIKDAAALGQGHFHSGRDARQKKNSFDNWNVPVAGLELTVSVGLADETGELERVLLWGVGRWGSNDEAAATADRLRLIEAPGFRLVQIDGSKAVGFGGTYVALVRSLKPEDLRKRSGAELIAEIAADLRSLRERLGAPEADEFLVGATKDAQDSAGRIEELIGTTGRAATWWSFPVDGEKAEVLRRYPYLYLYSPTPTQKVVYRLHVRDHQTSTGEQGIRSPWPEHTPSDERDTTAAGSTKDLIFKTWLLVDSVEVLDPPLTLADVERPDGSSANPVALRNAFAVWRMRQRPPAGLKELVDTTNLRPEELAEIETLLLQKQQIILEGPPGSGKTFIARLFGRYFTGNPLGGEADERLQIVQFHQSYSYEDFIEGIRPRTNESGQIGYRVEDGIFKRLCRLAADERNRDRRFVLIVDEINRGNISRIFGELLLLFEYRESQMPVTLPYSGETFTIPSNIFLVGTMNTTDRSLAVIDYALRRRFYFYRLMPVRDGRAAVLEAWLAKQTIPEERRKRIVELFVALNVKVQQELGEHFQVGHSYLMTADAATEEGLHRIWQRAIMPLLEEYFYNRKDRSGFLRAFDIDGLLRTAASEVPEGQIEGDGGGG